MFQRLFFVFFFCVNFNALVQAQGAELGDIDCKGLHQAAQTRTLSDSEKDAFIQCVASRQIEENVAGISTEDVNKHGLAGGINSETRKIEQLMNPFRW